MIKIGQYIGMGKTSIDLLVEVQSINGHMMRGRVINGCWDFDYSLLTGKMDFDTPTGHTSFNTNLLFTGLYPDNLHNYNDIMNYMDKYLESRWYAKLMSRVRNIGAVISIIIREAPTRAGNAVAFARAGWAVPPKTLKNARHYDDPVDDDIPF